MTATPRILIAIPTYRRTALLPPLIDAVRTESAGFEARILVVDNDPDASAEPVATSEDVQYLHQPIPGIAAVRQAALDAADADELTVMIDDDVFPEPGWLAGLVSVYAETGATVVMGYVRYVWPEGTDPWIAAGGFMRRTLHPNGTRLSALATGNVLIDTQAVRALGVQFDLTLGLLGGEDNAFGRAVLAQGGTILASADSVARDDIPVERTTLAFVRRRAISHGQARVRLLIRERPLLTKPVLHAFHLLGGAVRWIAFSAGGMLAAVRRDTAAHAIFRRRTWFAEGRMLAALGIVTAEYARPTTATQAQP